MARLLLAASAWLIATLPCQAATVLEFGTSPHVSVHVEGNRASFGLGISAQYHEDTFSPIFGISEKIRIWTFSPSAIARLFLSDGTTRSFLEARASKEIPSVSGDIPDFIIGNSEDFLDDWTTSLGLGFRAGINERFRIGGAVDAWAEFQTFPDREDTIRGGTAFRVFLDYALSH